MQALDPNVGGEVIVSAAMAMGRCSVQDRGASF